MQLQSPGEGKCPQRSGGSPLVVGFAHHQGTCDPSLEEFLVPVVPPGVGAMGQLSQGQVGKEEGRVKAIPASMEVPC